MKDSAKFTFGGLCSLFSILLATLALVASIGLYRNLSDSSASLNQVSDEWRAPSLTDI